MCTKVERIAPWTSKYSSTSFNKWRGLLLLLDIYLFLVSTPDHFSCTTFLRDYFETDLIYHTISFSPKNLNISLDNGT